MPFNWLKKQATEPEPSSRLQVKISTKAITEARKEAQLSEQAIQFNGNIAEDNVFIPAHNEGYCGFVTLVPDKEQPSSNQKMTSSDINAVREKLQADKQFRDKVLTVETMAERMELISAKGLSCSANELRIILDTFVDKKNDDSRNNFTLWGNKIH